jgi:hypothetical protein
MYVDSIYGMDLYFIHLYYSTNVAHTTKVQLQWKPFEGQLYGDTWHLKLISIFIIINELIIFEPSYKVGIGF